VRVDAPDGPLLTRGGHSGSAVTGRWVKNRMTFYLQDVSGGKRLLLANTLAAVKIYIRGPEHAKSAEAVLKR